MESKTYFFQPEKKALKQGFFLQDENEKTVYEAKMLKQPLFGPMVFDFINHISNRTTQHQVGKTVTSETSGALGFISTKSYFKYDGKKIWVYLHEQGVRMDSSLAANKLGMVYDVTLKGQPVARIASAAPKGGLKFVTTSFCYDVTTTEEYLDLAFLVAFAVARTDQTFYS